MISPRKRSLYRYVTLSNNQTGKGVGREVAPGVWYRTIDTDAVLEFPATGVRWFRLDGRTGMGYPIEATNHPHWTGRLGTRWNEARVLQTLGYE